MALKPFGRISVPERMRIRSVIHVTREFAGLAEAGGVKDAVAGLAKSLVRLGVRTTVVLPLYGFLMSKLNLGRAAFEFDFAIPDQDKKNRMKNERVRSHSIQMEGVRFLLIESPRFAEKNDVYTYTAADEIADPYKKKGTGHWDFHQMNLLLQRAALESALKSVLAGEDVPDVFHCHDGHAAFLPAIMREDRRMARGFAKTGSVVTIHNAGVGYHQEIWDPEFAELVTGLRGDVLKLGLIAGTVDPLLLSGSYARMSTVSTQYALELLSEKNSEVSGGLGRAFRERGIPVTGITNGVDPAPFDPRNPVSSGVPYGFDPEAGELEGKARCKKDLLGELSFGADSEKRPLFGFIGRLTRQKGIDILVKAVSDVLQKGCSADFVVLGQGEAKDEELFHALSKKSFSGGALRFVPRYDFGLSKRIYAGSDFLLIPSEYEPCGLTDFHAQLMGSIPVVHRVGGLLKVRDSETGFSYEEQTPSALADAIRRCILLDSRDPAALDKIRRKAFREIFEKHTWDTVARDGYLPLYEAASRRER